MLSIAVVQRAVRMKIVASNSRLDERAVSAALEGFLERLTGARFGAIVLDYDGTIVDAENKKSGPVPAVVTSLTRILEAGLTIGIATGRGKSVRQELKRCLPASLVSLVWIGYYNGGIIAQLADEAQPPQSEDLHPSLVPAAEILEGNEHIRSIAQITKRPPQITLEAKVPMEPGHLWSAVDSLLETRCSPAPRRVSSTHSVDVLAAAVSKRRLVEHLREKLSVSRKVPGEFLCIGDRGQWPGNDFELLSEPYSLSVDEVSENPESCWNLSTDGASGSAALLEYFSWLVLSERVARLDLPAT